MMSMRVCHLIGFDWETAKLADINPEAKVGTRLAHEWNREMRTEKMF